MGLVLEHTPRHIHTTEQAGGVVVVVGGGGLFRGVDVHLERWVAGGSCATSLQVAGKQECHCRYR